MLKFLVLMLLVVSCGKPQDGKDGLAGPAGKDGIPGSDGLEYYSYTINVNLQEIVGDGVKEVFETSEGDLYQLPRKLELTVDNPYSGCQLRDVIINIEAGGEISQFVFEANPGDRYKMKYKSGPKGKVIDSPTLKMYYENEPEVDCGNAIYRLHSGLQFELRIIKEFEL